MSTSSSSPPPVSVINKYRFKTNAHGQHLAKAVANFSAAEEQAKTSQKFDFVDLKEGQYVNVTQECNEYWSIVEYLPPLQGRGVVPTGFLNFVKFSHDGKEQFTDQYEAYYRNFRYKCRECLHLQPHAVPKYHCFDCDEYDFYNICQKCYNQIGLKELQERHKKYYKHELVMSPMLAHPGHTHWTVVAKSTAETLNNAFMRYKERPCLGYRKMVVEAPNKKKLEDKLTWLTYDEVYQRILNFAGGLRSIIRSINKEQKKPLDSQGFVGLCSNNRVEWFIGDCAIIFNGYVSAPIQRTKLLEGDISEVAHMINNSEASIMICSKQFTRKYQYLASTQCPTLKVIIEMTNENRDEDETPATDDLPEFKLPADFTVLRFADVENMGKLAENKFTQIVTLKPEDLMTIVYTSGSTGVPKGAIITDNNFNTSIDKAYWPYHPLVVISFSPLAHLSDRLNVYNCITSGGRAGIYSGDMNIIFEDIQMIKPALLSSTPRLFDRIYGEYHKAIALLEAQYEKNQGSAEELEAEKKKIFEDVPNILGGRMKAITVGGAPPSEAVLEFLRKAFKCPVNNGYASTECGSIRWISAASGKNQVDGVQIKLIDVPELGYFTTDKPYARGEICVKSSTVIPGYYKNEEKNKEAFKEGWFLTGDIGEQLENGDLRIIDRKKAIFKLSQGEYVAPAMIENILLKSSYIDQIFVHGDSFKSFLVAVVIPKEPVVRAWLEMNVPTLNAASLSLQEICKIPAIKKVIFEDIQAIGKESKKQPYEIPKAIMLDYTKFTSENGLLTDSLKLCRHKLTKHYYDALTELYQQTEQQDSMNELQAVIQNALGLAGKEGAEEKTFAELGGDSLTAAKISYVLGQKGVQITASQLLNKELTLSDLQKIIDKQKITGTAFAQSDMIDIAKELDNLLTEIPQVTPALESTLVPAESVNAVLLTGVTGFLGPFILESLLQMLPNKHAKIYCVIRATNMQEAQKRLVDTLQKSSIVLSAADQARVIAVVGDLTKPKLGLEQWEQLSNEVDAIVHNGAEVNFQLSYSSLKKPNVLSTVELMKLATLNKYKALHYVSTASVLHYSESPNGELIKENEPLLTPERKATFPKIGGYAQTKFICESLLQRAAQERNFTKFTIFRMNMVGPHSKYGTVNLIDWVVRMMASFVMSKIAPISDAQILMAPVDFIANCIAGITSSSQKTRDLAFSKRVFYLQNLNPVNDGDKISINDIVEATKKFGYTDIVQVPHQQWSKQKQALLTTPSSSAAASSSSFVSSYYKADPILPILNMFELGIGSMVETQDSSNTIELLKNATVKIECPKLTHALVQKALQFLVSQKIIPSASHQEPATTVNPTPSPKSQQPEPVQQQPLPSIQPIINTNAVRDGDW